MREFDALAGYPSGGPRKVGVRTILNRITASRRDFEFFDGARADGYGGLVNDGRWGNIARAMATEYRLGAPSSVYGLAEPSKVLQVGAEKGFLLAEFVRMGLVVQGTETSRYAIQCSEVPLLEAQPTALPFADGSFDLVLAIGPVYTLALADAMKALAEIERVKKPGGHAFVTLGAWETEKDYWLLRAWSLLGTTLLRHDEWIEVLGCAGYTADYKFVTAQSLELSWN